MEFWKVCLVILACIASVTVVQGLTTMDVSNCLTAPGTGFTSNNWAQGYAGIQTNDGNKLYVKVNINNEMEILHFWGLSEEYRYANINDPGLVSALILANSASKYSKLSVNDEKFAIKSVSRVVLTNDIACDEIVGIVKSHWLDLSSVVRSQLWNYIGESGPATTYG